MEDMLYKFIDEVKQEQEEMRAFINEFRTTNELLFKERNNSLSELRFEVYELLRVINNALISNYEVKGVTTRDHDKPVEPKEVLVENEHQKTNELVVQPSIECQPIAQYIDFSGSDQIQTPQYPDVHPPSQKIEKEEPPQDSDIRHLIREECYVEVSEEQKQSMEDTMLELVKIFQEKEFLCIHDNVDDLIESALNSKLLLIFFERQEVKNIVEQPAERGNLIIQSFQNFRVIHKSSISLNTSQISSIHAVATILSTEEPEHSLSIEYEHLSITSETESDEVTESNAKNLLPIPSECEVTSEDESKCDVPIFENSPICDDHSDIFSDSKIDDDFSVYDDDFKDIEYVEASLSNPEIVSIEVENVVQQEEEEVDLEDISQIQDIVLREKLLSIIRLISNIESLNDNSTPDHERLINVLKSNIPDDSSNDLLLEEVDLFLASDNSIPPGIENVANDTKGDIRFLEELLINDSILSHESSDSNFERVRILSSTLRLAKKNELKARGSLLMTLPDKHQIKFNIHKDAKSLMEAIEKRFGGNKETKKVQKTLLKQQYENFTGSNINLKFLRSLLIEWRTHTLNWRNKTDLEEQSLDDLFNNLKIYEAKVKSSSSTSPTTQNIAFVSSQNTDSTNESVSVVTSVSAASNKVLVSALPIVDNLNADDLEEMDLKWQMVMLTIRARRRGHFTREYRSPKDTRNKDTQKRNVPVETSTSNALVSQCDGVGSYDWSFQADEEPTNYALMAFTSSSSTNSSGLDSEVAPFSKACSKAYATFQSHYDNLTNDLRKYQFDVLSYKTGLESVKARLVVYQQNENVFEDDIKLLKLDVMLTDNALVELRKKFEKAKQERDELGYDNQVFDSIVFDFDELISSESDIKMPTSLMHDRHVVSTTVLTRCRLVLLTAARPVTTVVPQTNVQHQRYMIGNISYLFDFEEINRGYVAFGGNLKGGKITGKDSLLPIPFWAEAVNTVCYVQDRVLVTKPHNKTPYELLLGRTPSIGFMRPFGCLVTILNTLDPLGKFDGKANEGFLVGYSVRSGPTWLFDIDTLTQSMNYQPVVAENQPNFSRGIQENLTTGTGRKEFESVQQYVLIPLWSFGSKYPQNTDVAAFEVKEPESEVHVSPSSSDKPKKHDEKEKREAKGNSLVELSTGVRDLSDEFEEFSYNNTDGVNATSTPVTAVGPTSTDSSNTFSVAGPFNTVVSLTFEIGGKFSFMDPSEYPNDLNIPDLEDITYSDEEDVGAEADFSNLETNITVSPIPTTSVHKDHPITQIIEEPKRVHRELKDPSWIEAMQEDLLQFKMQKEEGIDYEEVFAPVARIEAIMLFLAYASVMGFMVYQKDVKNAFLYGTIKEEVGKIDQTLFIKKQKGDILLVHVYVDDIIFGSTNKELCKAFEKLMKDKFQMSLMGELTFFLGLQVKQKPDGIFSSQDKYVAKILGKFGLTNGKSASTLIHTEKPLLKDPDGEDVDVHTYSMKLLEWTLHLTNVSSAS
uniref:Reverse transcriptase Ty1/copia-type domain-containing protein n=1 Tax=Tanacetum cinerariifolium TaxID=118510 RepID=A0A6L2MSZ3_TANCI|nr:hypothetical protein [Tanacetum cinerariifolium]